MKKRVKGVLSKTFKNSNLKLGIGTPWLVENFPRAKGFEFQVLVCQLGMEFGPHLSVINSKFQVLVGFEPLTKVANTGPKAA